jgi:preprotein translocase subunit SecY
MLQAFLNIWKVRDLRIKLMFTISMLAIYRIGSFIPLPAVNQESLRAWAERAQDGAAGTLMTYVGLFTGGNLGQSTIFGLGIMPYISAAIIFQLLTTVLPSLQQLRKEGAAGQQKIQEYTRYATVGLCLIQATFWLRYIQTQNLIYPEYSVGAGAWIFWTGGILGLTGGTVFLMWLGEQIDKYGIGNGISLIITAGIVAQMPGAITTIAQGFSLTGADAARPYGIDTVLFLLAAFVAVVAGSVILTQGQRRIPIQQAKHTRGRRVYGGQKSYLPLRVNHGGVMPIIFASSLMIFPTMLFQYMASAQQMGDYWIVRFLARSFQEMAGFPYILIYIGLIYFFAYFWTTVQFQPKEMATQLRDHGSFIPGLRPGPRTAEYLETVMERITYVGAGFLAIIAVIPSVVHGAFQIPFNVSSFLGGTGLLIVVSVMLDFVQRIEAALLMRNYQGFLGGTGKGGRIRGARS